MEIRPVGTEVFHADGEADTQTDKRDVAKSRTSQFWGGA